jgi:hypothetical protein
MNTVLWSYSRSQWPFGLRRKYLPLGYGDRGFECRTRHGRLYPSFCILLSCRGRGLIPIQGVRPNVELVHIFRSNSELAQVTSPNPLKYMMMKSCKSFSQYNNFIHVLYVHIFYLQTSFDDSASSSQNHLWCFTHFTKCVPSYAQYISVTCIIYSNFY